MMLSSRNTILMVALLAGSIISISGLVNAYTRHESAQRIWMEQTSRTTQLLAQHATQALYSAQTVLVGLAEFSETGEDDRSENLLDGFSENYENKIVSSSIRRVMNDLTVNNPFIDGAGFYSRDAKLLAKSERYDAPDINGQFEHYFPDLADGANDKTNNRNDKTYISEPVKGSETGRWVFYLARRVNDRVGQMDGFVVVAVAVSAFSDFYAEVGKNFGDEASISLYSSDLMLMARWPFNENLIAKRNTSSATKEMIHTYKLTNGVLINNLPRMSMGEAPQLRMTVARVVDNFPLIVTIVIPRTLYLSEWDKVVKGIILRTLLAWTLLVVGTYFLLKSDSRLRKELNERKAAQELLHIAHEQLEARVVERTAELTKEIKQRHRIEQELIVANRLTASVSHRAGMAEVANSVLHNVGNVLTSVNVSVSILRDQLESTSMKDLPRAAGLLRSHAQDLAYYLSTDRQGRLLPQFFEMLATQWQAEHSMMHKETEQLESSVQHIKDIVNRQQSLSGRGGLIESFNIQDVINDVLNIHALILKEAGVVVREHLGKNWGMLGDRSKLTQVVLNLVVNAQESIVMAQVEPRLIDITTSINDDETVTFEIKDNGQGIDPENLKNMFTYGFTTKKTGHGFGLHASALAAIEMGGKLDVFSDGFGKGATFLLTLPKIHPDAV